MKNQRLPRSFYVFETLVERYGQTITHGGTPVNMFRGIRMAKLVAKLAGVSVEDVLVEVREICS